MEYGSAHSPLATVYCKQNGQLRVIPSESHNETTAARKRLPYTPKYQITSYLTLKIVVAIGLGVLFYTPIAFMLMGFALDDLLQAVPEPMSIVIKQVLLGGLGMMLSLLLLAVQIKLSTEYHQSRYYHMSTRAHNGVLLFGITVVALLEFVVVWYANYTRDQISDFGSLAIAAFVTLVNTIGGFFYAQALARRQFILSEAYRLLYEENRPEMRSLEQEALKQYEEIMGQIPTAGNHGNISSRSTQGGN